MWAVWCSSFGERLIPKLRLERLTASACFGLTLKSHYGKLHQCVCNWVSFHFSSQGQRQNTQSTTWCFLKASRPPL